MTVLFLRFMQSRCGRKLITPGENFWWTGDECMWKNASIFLWNICYSFLSDIVRSERHPFNTAQICTLSHPFLKMFFLISLNIWITFPNNVGLEVWRLFSFWLPCFSNSVKIIPDPYDNWWRRKWQPTRVFLLDNPMDRGDWWTTVHGVVKESDMSEGLNKINKKR